MAATVDPSVMHRIPNAMDPAELTHAQRADVIAAAMVRAGRYASRQLGSAVGSSLLSCAVVEGRGIGFAPGAEVRQGLFLASDATDGEGSDLE